MIVYFNGRFIEKEEVRISPDDRGFLFADGTYEVVRIYRGKPFRLQDHLSRFANSLAQIGLSLPDLSDLNAVTDGLIRKNGMEEAEAALYLQVTRGAAPRHHPFPDPGTPPTVYAAVSPVAPPHRKWADGVKAILLPDLRWGRCDIKSISLLANVLAAQRAKEAGAEEAIFLRDGVVTEGSHTNVAAAFGTSLWTHPVGTSILDGITRDVVLGLCSELAIPVVEEPIPENRFRRSDEIMILGTSTEIMPVVRLDDAPVGTGKPGPLAGRLQKAFFNLTRS